MLWQEVRKCEAALGYAAKPCLRTELNKDMIIQEQIVASNVLQRPKLQACAELMALLYWLGQFSGIVKAGSVGCLQETQPYLTWA